MDYQTYQKPMNYNRQPIKYTLIEPYVIETLRMIIGRSVVIETVRGNIQGVLTDVRPDHVVLRPYSNDTIFYVRLQQIVHVMPV